MNWSKTYRVCSFSRAQEGRYIKNENVLYLQRWTDEMMALQWCVSNGIPIREPILLLRVVQWKATESRSGGRRRRIATLSSDFQYTIYKQLYLVLTQPKENQWPIVSHYVEAEIYDNDQFVRNGCVALNLRYNLVQPHYNDQSKTNTRHNI